MHIKLDRYTADCFPAPEFGALGLNWSERLQCIKAGFVVRDGERWRRPSPMEYVEDALEAYQGPEVEEAQRWMDFFAEPLTTQQQQFLDDIGEIMMTPITTDQPTT